MRTGLQIQLAAVFFFARRVWKWYNSTSFCVLNSGDMDFSVPACANSGEMDFSAEGHAGRDSVSQEFNHF